MCNVGIRCEIVHAPHILVYVYKTTWRVTSVSCIMIRLRIGTLIRRASLLMI